VCKKSIKNSQPFVKKMKNVRTPQGGFFLTHTVYVICVVCRWTSSYHKTKAVEPDRRSHREVPVGRGYCHRVCRLPSADVGSWSADAGDGRTLSAAPVARRWLVEWISTIVTSDACVVSNSNSVLVLEIALGVRSAEFLTVRPP